MVRYLPTIYITLGFFFFFSCLCSVPAGPWGVVRGAWCVGHGMVGYGWMGWDGMDLLPTYVWYMCVCVVGGEGG